MISKRNSPSVERKEEKPDLTQEGKYSKSSRFPEGSGCSFYREMYTHYSHSFQKKIITLHPGEYFVSREDLYIATVLGSCVAVTIYNRARGIGGMNHYLLPGVTHTAGNEARYGQHAMELLLHKLLAEGAVREELRAKVFGGGNVLAAQSAVGSNNVHFALSLLDRWNIPVTDRDVEGEVARKLFMEPRTGKVYVKRLEQSLLEHVDIQIEKDLEKIRKKDVYGDFILFEN